MNFIIRRQNKKRGKIFLKVIIFVTDYQETYRGSEASSEPETKAVATALLAIKDKVFSILVLLR